MPERRTTRFLIERRFPQVPCPRGLRPAFACQAPQAEGKIGTMLPGNVIVQETRDGKVEISAVNPVVSIASIRNPKLRAVAEQVRAKPKSVVERF